MSAPSIVSFGWEAGRSKQVFYVADDGKVHELYKIAGAPWSHAPTSMLAHSAAQVGSGNDYQLIGFAWEANHSKHVFFVDEDENLHELSVDTRGSWRDENLSFPGLGHLATGYAWEPVGYKHLITYSDSGVEISELHFKGNRWQPRNLSSAARFYMQALVRAASSDSPGGASFTAYGWPAGDSQQVAFIGLDGHIHELINERTSESTWDEVWKHTDLTLKTGAPPPADFSENSFITGYAWEEGRSKQVLYFDRNGAIHELYRNSGANWCWANLTARTGAPQVSSSRYNRMVGYGWPLLGTKQVVFIGDDRHVHEMYCGKNSDWAEAADLTTIAQSADEPSRFGAPPAHRIYNLITACAWGWGGSKQVYYVDADNHIIELSVGRDGCWQFLDLTSRTSSPPII